jgi:hypothetical protein
VVSDREALADPAEIVQPTIGATSHGTAPGAETVARWALAAVISSFGRLWCWRRPWATDTAVSPGAALVTKGRWWQSKID